MNTLVSKVDFKFISTPTIDDKDIYIKQACCVALCRTALRQTNIEEEKRVYIAKILTTLLKEEVVSLLETCVAGIRILINNYICYTELLSDNLIVYISEIAIKYIKQANLCRLCCSVLGNKIVFLFIKIIYIID